MFPSLDETQSLPPETSTARRLDRIANKAKTQNFCAMQFISDDPVKNAMSSKNSAEWKDAMEAEMESRLGNNTWSLTKLPHAEKAKGMETITL